MLTLPPITDPLMTFVVVTLRLAFFPTVFSYWCDVPVGLSACGTWPADVGQVL
jgi:hypothetical protein